MIGELLAEPRAHGRRRLAARGESIADTTAGDVAALAVAGGLQEDDP